MYNLNLKIGHRIARLRRAHHLTQANLAESLNISSKHCSNVERGRSTFSLDLMIEVCDRFDVSLDYLVRGKTSGNLPKEFIAYWENADEKEQEVLKSYMDMYINIRKLPKQK